MGTTNIAVRAWGTEHVETSVISIGYAASRLKR
jgi:hypothetical protein